MWRTTTILMTTVALLIVLAVAPAAAGLGRGQSSSGLLDSRSPTVDILYPTEQEIFSGGSTVTFQWTVSETYPGQDPDDHFATVFIDGSAYESFPFTYGDEHYEWLWTVPDTISSDCHLEVVAYDLWQNMTVVITPDFTLVLSTTNVSSDPPTPAELALGPARPNPFNPSTDIAFDLPATGEIDLAVYDLLGRRVRRRAHGSWSVGRHTVTWDGLDDVGHRTAGGVYLVRLTYAGLQKNESLVYKVVMVP